MSNNKLRPLNDKNEEEDNIEVIANLHRAKHNLGELYRIIVTEKFTVNEVVAEYYTADITPHSEMIFGGISHSYEGGYISELELEVSPDNPNVPIKTLIFHGCSPVKVGDYISAKIPKFEEKRAGTEFPSDEVPYSKIEDIPQKIDITPIYNNIKGLINEGHIDIHYNPKEIAIELAILSSDGKVLRTDRAANYRNIENL